MEVEKLENVFVEYVKGLPYGFERYLIVGKEYKAEKKTKNNITKYLICVETKNKYWCNSEWFKEREV